MSDINELKSRAKDAFAKTEQWEDQLSDAYDYFLPGRNLYNGTSAGQKKMDKIFDSTPSYALHLGASKLQENIAPIWQRWAKLEIAEEIKKANEKEGSPVDIKEKEEQAEETTEIAFDYINRSNFSTSFYEMALDLLIGTGTIYIKEDDDDDKPFSFHTIPQISIGFEEGPDGSIETHWRKHRLPLRNLERTWTHLTLSQQISERIKKDPNGMASCTEGIVYIPTTKTYRSVVWLEDEERLSRDIEIGEIKPMITGRYSKTSGEVRGRGPVLMVLPDAKTLNRAKYDTLARSSLELAGMWTATDDGVTNPYTIRIAPRLIIPVGSNNSANPSISRLDTGGPVDLSLFVIEDLRNAIKMALFNDIRDPAGPVRSATEIAIESRELAKRIGSAYGRLQTEVLMPILDSVMAILARRGKIPSIYIDKKIVDIKFTSPLARHQDMEDLINVQQAVEFVAGTAGPNEVMLSYKTEEFARWSGERVGIPSELVRSKEERKEAGEAITAAAQSGVDATNGE